MEAFIRYILISTFCLSVLYLGYLIFQKKETRFNHLRYFLILSIVLAVIVPFSTFRIDLNLSSDKYDIKEINQESTQTIAKIDDLTFTQANVKPKNNDYNLNIESLLIILYFIGLSLFSLRILVHLMKILYLFATSKRIEQDKIVLLNNKTGSPFTFISWIFIPSNFEENKYIDILTHERIHASQYHSIDLIMIELLAAVMWFNPLVWMMKKSVQLVHEYLADEGVLNTGTDKLRYQALLINQVAEERLICLSSSFNHSLIKKRIIMMTKSNFNQGSKLRILTLIPLATVLFVAVACVNGQDKSDVITAVEPVRMNVLYIGVDNPIKIAASGYDASDLTATIDNGTISGKNGEYVIRPKEQGSATVSVSSNGKEIQKTTFRVKVVPDPIAAIKCKNDLKTSGGISKKELLEDKKITVLMRNFDFDLSFEVVSFVMSSTVPNSLTVKEEISNSNDFSKQQIDLINSLIINQKLIIEDIIIKGPDGVKRKLSPMVFTITE